MSLRKKSNRGGHKITSRATKKERVDVTREIVESLRMLDGPEVDAFALRTHRALDEENWHEARMELASMTGHFNNPKVDLGLRLNMALLEELEDAQADGKFTQAEKKKVEQVRRGIDSVQKTLIDEYYEGSISGVAKKKMEHKRISAEDQKSTEDYLQRKAVEDRIRTFPKEEQKSIEKFLANMPIQDHQKWLDQIENQLRMNENREKVMAGGSIEHVREVQKRIEKHGGKTKIVDTGRDTVTDPPYRIYDLIQMFSEKEWQDMNKREQEWREEEDRQRREWTPAKTAEFEVHGLGHQKFTFLNEFLTEKEAEKALLEKFGPVGIGSPIRFKIQKTFRGDDPVYLAYYYKLSPLQIRAKDMEYLDQIVVIRKWVKKHVPTVSVRRGTGTAYSYIEIWGDKRGRSFTEREKDGFKKLGLNYGGNCAIIGPDNTDFWTAEALKDLEKK